MDIHNPIRADFRYIRKLLDISFSGQVEHNPKEYLRVTNAFQKMGGSWEKLFLGSPKDLELLRNLLKIAVKKGFITKAYKWED